MSLFLFPLSLSFSSLLLRLVFLSTAFGPSFGQVLLSFSSLSPSVLSTISFFPSFLSFSFLLLLLLAMREWGKNETQENENGERKHEKRERVVKMEKRRETEIKRETNWTKEDMKQFFSLLLSTLQKILSKKVSSLSFPSSLSITFF